MTPDKLQAKRLRLALNETALAVHRNAINKGWWKDRMNMSDMGMRHSPEMSRFARKAIEAQLIALTISELSEGLEGLREDLQDDHIPEFKMIEAELADAIIRILDHAAAFGYRIGEAVVAKMAYNETRPQLHGGKAF